MHFIAQTPPEYYLMGSAGNSIYYIIVLNPDVVEYLTNEFQVQDLIMVPPAEVKKMISSCSKTWGNQGLLDLV